MKLTDIGIGCARPALWTFQIPLLTMLVTLSSLLARADVVWLKPEQFAPAPSTAVGIELVVGDEFGAKKGLVPPFQVDSLEGRLAGQAVFPALLPVVNNAPRYVASFSRLGVATVRAELKPEARSISRSDVERYLRQLHVTDEVRAAWKQIGPPNPWLEVRRIRLKTFLRIGDPSPAASADPLREKTSESGVDLAPRGDPTTLHPGDSFSLQAVKDGRPFAGAVVEYLSTGETRQHVVIADENGRVTAQLDAPGEWLIRCFDVQRASAANHDWDVTIVGLTILAH